MAVLLAMALPLCAHAAGIQSPADAALRDLIHQEQILNGAVATTQPAEAARLRDQAAQRLVSRGSPEATEALLRVLRNAANRDGQLAVARALAAWSAPTEPDPAFIDPLVNLIGADADLANAAAHALAAFKNNDRVRTRLTGFANNLSGAMPVGTRIAVIRAMGKLVDKRAAGTLVQLVNSDTNPRIREAAMDGLVEMTGLTQYGRDAQQWTLWWDDNRSKPDAAWSRDLLYRNAARVGELEKRLIQVRDQAVRLIREDFQRSPEADRPKKLAACLQSEAEDIRWAAVRIVYEEVASKGGLSPLLPQVVPTLRAMVGDSSAEVRGEVARTLGAANDREAVAALLAQLPVEKDPAVRAAIAKALGPTHDLNAIDPLLARLDDESYSVAQASADALREMATVLREETNKARAATASRRLVQRLDALDPGDTASAALRHSLVQCMAQLAHPSMEGRFQALISPDREPLHLVRMSAYRGLGRLGRSATAPAAIVDCLQRERDPGVRVEAIDALGKCSGTFEFAQVLGRLLAPENEPDEAVRLKAWQVLELLLPLASEKELNYWAERFKGDNPVNLARRLSVLTELENKLVADKADERLAIARQNIGEALLKLEKFDAAATKFRQSLDYWTGIKAGPPVTDLLMQQLIESLLRAKRFADASQFASQVIQQNAANAEPVWWKVRNEIERLRKAADLDTALQLIEEARKIPLGQSYATLLLTMEKEIRELRTRGGYFWVRQMIAGNEHDFAPWFIDA